MTSVHKCIANAVILVVGARRTASEKHWYKVRNRDLVILTWPAVVHGYGKFQAR